MEGLTGLIIAGVILGWHIVSELLHRDEKKKLLNRLMAKNYDQYEYYEEKYQKDVAEVAALRDESRKEREKGEEDVVRVDDEVDLDQFEEEWSSEEMEQTKKGK